MNIDRIKRTTATWFRGDFQVIPARRDRADVDENPPGETGLARIAGLLLLALIIHALIILPRRNAMGSASDIPGRAPTVKMRLVAARKQLPFQKPSALVVEEVLVTISSSTISGMTTMMVRPGLFFDKSRTN